MEAVATVDRVSYFTMARVSRNINFLTIVSRLPLVCIRNEPRFLPAQKLLTPLQSSKIYADDLYHYNNSNHF